MPKNLHNPTKHATRRRDADVYREMRLAHASGDDHGVSTAMAKFSSDHARRCARSLSRDRNRMLAEALDRVLVCDGLRACFLLSNMHKIVSIRCPEVEIIRKLLPNRLKKCLIFYKQEISTYLSTLEDIWARQILQGDSTILTVDDVIALEQRCPCLNEEDREAIREGLIEGKIFSRADLEWRTAVFDRLCEIREPIPSFFTFHNDVRVLEEVAPRMLHLFHLKPNHTWNETLQANFLSDTYAFSDARRRLWEIATCYSQLLPMLPRKRKTDYLAKIRPAQSLAADLATFAQFAFNLGFRNEKIATLIALAPPASDPLSLEDPFRGTVLKHRSGFPDEQSFSGDRILLLQSAPVNQEYLTSHCVLTIWCRRFFGHMPSVVDGPRNSPVTAIPTLEPQAPESSMIHANERSPQDTQKRVCNKIGLVRQLQGVELIYIYVRGLQVYDTATIDSDHVEKAREAKNDDYTSHILKSGPRLSPTVAEKALSIAERTGAPIFFLKKGIENTHTLCAWIVELEKELGRKQKGGGKNKVARIDRNAGTN